MGRPNRQDDHEQRSLTALPGIGRRRGNSASGRRLLSDDHEEMAKRSQSTRVQIAPSGPLARAGLIQVVAQAGLTLAGAGDKPDVIFGNDVHFAPSSPGTPIQVGVQSDRVVIVVATPRRAPLLYRFTAGVSIADGPH